MVLVSSGSRTTLSKTCSVTEDVVLFGETGVHSLVDGSRVRFSLAADDEMVSWQERLVHRLVVIGLFS